MKHLHNIGLYFIMLKKMIYKPTKWSVMKQLILNDIEDLVINSLGIIAFVSFLIANAFLAYFIGGDVLIQHILDGPIIHLDTFIKLLVFITTPTLAKNTSARA